MGPGCQAVCMCLAVLPPKNGLNASSVIGVVWSGAASRLACVSRLESEGPWSPCEASHCYASLAFTAVDSAVKTYTYSFLF